MNRIMNNNELYKHGTNTNNKNYHIRTSMYKCTSTVLESLTGHVMSINQQQAKVTLPQKWLNRPTYGFNQKG